MPREADIRILAFTLPERNALNRILQEVGFQFAGEMQDEDERAVWRSELPATAK